MFTLYRLLLCALLPVLAGCAMFSSEAWQQPSPLSGRPPPPVPEARHEIQRGFTVAVDVPGQPTSARVMADIATLARQRGFVPQGDSSSASQRFVLGKIVLDATYDAAHLLVRAYLHSSGPGRDRKVMEQFDADFQGQYASGYGDQSAVVESDYGDGAANSPRGQGGPRGGGRGGR